MRAHGGLKRWPITNRQRAAFMAAKQEVALILAHGATPERIAQAQAEIDASKQPRQPQLALKVRG
jgi:hypothetical protein